MPQFDFAAILLLVTLFSGVVSISYTFFMKGKKQEKYPLIIDYCRSFFPALLAVLIIRSFIAQIYDVPTGSLEPTILPGEIILATQYNYGIRLPVWNTKIINIGNPRRGDIVLFRHPVNPNTFLIKRLIGVPGDRLSYVNNVLYINGKEMPLKLLGMAHDIELPSDVNLVEKYQENLDGLIHSIFLNPNQQAHNFYNVIIPPHKYFMMGDNRDNSDDSRYWGFVDENDLIGKGEFILLSWNNARDHWYNFMRWSRVGSSLSALKE